MQEMGKKWPKQVYSCHFLRHITQIQIDIIINVSFKYQNVKFYHSKKNHAPLRVHALEATH